MKTTVDLPDELHRRAEAEAELRGQEFPDLAAGSPAGVLEPTSERTAKPKMPALTKRARGVTDSRVSDLASNPEHLSGFGDDARLG